MIRSINETNERPVCATSKRRPSLNPGTLTPASYARTRAKIRLLYLKCLGIIDQFKQFILGADRAVGSLVLSEAVHAAEQSNASRAVIRETSSTTSASLDDTPIRDAVARSNILSTGTLHLQIRDSPDGQERRGRSYLSAWTDSCRRALPAANAEAHRRGALATIRTICTDVHSCCVSRTRLEEPIEVPRE